jgi:hypothetical protein
MVWGYLWTMLHLVTVYSATSKYIQVIRRIAFLILKNHFPNYSLWMNFLYHDKYVRITMIYFDYHILVLIPNRHSVPPTHLVKFK